MHSVEDVFVLHTRLLKDVYVYITLRMKQNRHPIYTIHYFVEIYLVLQDIQVFEIWSVIYTCHMLLTEQKQVNA